VYAVPSAVPPDPLNTESLNLVPIESLSDPRASDFANLPDKRLKSGPDRPRIPEEETPSGLFIAEGELVVRRLIESSYPVKSVLVTPSRLEHMRPALSKLDPGIPIFLAQPHVVNSIAGFKFHHGVLGCGVRRELPTVEEVLLGATGVAVVEDITNTDNLSSIFRSVSALERERPAVLLSPGCCDPLYRKCLRVSMGHALSVPFGRVPVWPDGLNALTESFRLVALTPDAPDLATLPRDGRPPALLVGTEGPGLTPGALAQVRQRASIPMRQGVDSLNVAVAFAIGMHALTGARAGPRHIHGGTGP